MTAKKVASKKASPEIYTSPFEQITKLELEQEGRVSHAMEESQSIKSTLEKTVKEAEISQEEQLRTKATAELEEFARTEPLALLKQSEKETTAAMTALSKHADKHFAKTLNATLSPLLDGSLFANAA